MMLVRTSIFVTKIMQLILNFTAYIIEKQTNLKYVKKILSRKKWKKISYMYKTVCKPWFDEPHNSFWKKNTFTVCTEKNSTYPGIVEQSNFSRYRPKNLLDEVQSDHLTKYYYSHVLNESGHHQILKRRGFIRKLSSIFM